ncbi:hypothetical protein NPIL_440351 [Nephila pilipes]|uniref:Uncharacterized protein n=1 Tax=Nephila pilipes TaxID=299642 RepID=A0A8X6NG15_NEPPI|nr:hypothetical protein NPIL_440351 [Nephila pilipes]
MGMPQIKDHPPRVQPPKRRREKVDVSITGDKSKMIVQPSEKGGVRRLRLRQVLTVMTRSTKVWTPRRFCSSEHLGSFPGVPISLSSPTLSPLLERGESADWWVCRWKLRWGF